MELEEPEILENRPPKSNFKPVNIPATEKTSAK